MEGYFSEGLSTGSGGGEEAGECLGRNVLPVVEVTVALGYLCDFVHEMAAWTVVSCGKFRWIWVYRHEMPLVATGDGYGESIPKRR